MNAWCTWLTAMAFRLAGTLTGALIAKAWLVL
jgi:hypothetical protein